MIIRPCLPHSPDLGNYGSQFVLARLLVAALGATIIFAGCDRRAHEETGGPRHYEVRGIIRGFAPDRRAIDVEHENIRGFMPSMTMPFPVRDQKEITGLQIGDAISFRFAVSDQDSWIDRIKKISATEVRLPAPTAAPKTESTSDSVPRLREGDPMPSFTLTDQNGERVTLEKFGGKAFVLTFIFTRCAIPNFCPRMSSNFAELQTAIKAGGEALAKTRLLSITLDPVFDTPQVLKDYGAHEQADPGVWTLATGNAPEIDALTHAFSVYRQTEGGTISHGLATALIDKGGKIDKIWRGNAWTPAEILAEIRKGE